MNKPAPLPAESTALLARVIIASGSKIRVIAVYEGSTYYQYYFMYSSDKPTAPRSSWKFLRISPVSVAGCRSLDDFVTKTNQIDFPNLIKFVDRKLFVTEQQLQEFHDKIAGPAFPAVQPKPRGFWFSNRDCSFDHLPISKNEVLVYTDLCTCGRNHMIAHYPDGHTLCAGYSELKNNPGLEYTGYQNNIFRFVYRLAEA